MLVRSMAVDLRADNIRVQLRLPQCRQHRRMPKNDIGLADDAVFDDSFPVHEPEDIANYLLMALVPEDQDDQTVTHYWPTLGSAANQVSRFRVGANPLRKWSKRWWITWRAGDPIAHFVDDSHELFDAFNIDRVLKLSVEFERGSDNGAICNGELRGRGGRCYARVDEHRYGTAFVLDLT